MAKKAFNSTTILPSSSASKNVKPNELRRSTRLKVVFPEKENTLKLGAKSKTKQKKKKVKVDAKMPKKPPTAFFYFLEDFRKEFQEQNPDVKAMREVGKACGEKWRTMTYEEKIKYYDIATEKRAEFDMSMAEFVKRKERGEDKESEDYWESYE